jgi:hypothetical protein
LGGAWVDRWLSNISHMCKVQPNLKPYLNSSRYFFFFFFFFFFALSYSVVALIQAFSVHTVGDFRAHSVVIVAS